MYQKIVPFLQKFMSDAQIYKYGFNYSPMYKRTTAKIIAVSDDLNEVKIKIPISYKNKNYAGSIFGGSLFAATDPIYMIQLIQILGNNYVVWDKAASIKYKRPAKKTAYASFIFSKEEIETIKAKVTQKKEITVEKELTITDQDNTIFAEVFKTLYVADKQFYKEKLKQKRN